MHVCIGNNTSPKETEYNLTGMQVRQQHFTLKQFYLDLWIYTYTCVPCVCLVPVEARGIPGAGVTADGELPAVGAGIQT